MKSRLPLFAFALLFSLSLGAGAALGTKDSAHPLKYSVAPAPEWTELVKRSHGWFGADGIFSVPLSGVDKNNNAGNESTLLLFSDTFIGEVNDGKPSPGYMMVNNSIAYIRGNDPDPKSIRFYYKKSKDDKPVSIFVPETSTAARPQHFWLGDGFVNKEL